MVSDKARAAQTGASCPGGGEHLIDAPRAQRAPSPPLGHSCAVTSATTLRHNWPHKYIVRRPITGRRTKCATPTDQLDLPDAAAGDARLLEWRNDNQLYIPTNNSTETTTHTHWT